METIKAVATNIASVLATRPSPKEFVSEDTLAWLGFTRPAARHLFREMVKHYTLQHLSQNPHEFVFDIVKHITRATVPHNDACGPEEAACRKALGVARFDAAFQNAVLHPHCSPWRERVGLNSWVKIVLVERLWTLYSMLEDGFVLVDDGESIGTPEEAYSQEAEEEEEDPRYFRITPPVLLLSKEGFARQTRFKAFHSTNDQSKLDRNAPDALWAAFPAGQAAALRLSLFSHDNRPSCKELQRQLAKLAIAQQFRLSPWSSQWKADLQFFHQRWAAVAHARAINTAVDLPSTRAVVVQITPPDFMAQYGLPMGLGNEEVLKDACNAVVKMWATITTPCVRKERDNPTATTTATAGARTDKFIWPPAKWIVEGESARASMAVFRHRAKESTAQLELAMMIQGGGITFWPEEEEGEEGGDGGSGYKHWYGDKPPVGLGEMGAQIAREGLGRLGDWGLRPSWL